jgi:apolipoprotein N-acyltransferase
VVDRADRPDFIFNPSNDAWFGWWGPPQHFAQARLRAVEEGLPVLRSTPTGVTGVIDAYGRVAATVPPGGFAVLDHALPPARSATLFARIGNVAPFLLALLLIGAAIVHSRLQLRRKRDTERLT